MQDFYQRRKSKKVSSLANSASSGQTGFTLIEVLIVVAILALLVTTLLFFSQRHLMRSRDATRKSDIDRIKVAFEEYYNDNRCYPSPHLLNNCGSTALSPYLKEIPCDPLTKSPYFYQSLNEDYCQGYRLLTKLEIETDQDIMAVGCDPIEGCGGEDGEDYNWGVSMGGSVSTTVWHTGGSGDDGEETGAFYCTPIYGRGYECRELTYQERWDYFEMREGDSCNSHATEEVCSTSCISNGGLEPGVACVCLNPQPNPPFSGCQ